jgi:hypothetical protein
MQHTMHINPEGELSRRLKAAAVDKKPLRLVSGNTVYDVQVHEHEAVPSARPGLDPARVRQGLARSAGALRGVDLARLKQELREAREQDSAGRPA